MSSKLNVDLLSWKMAAHLFPVFKVLGQTNANVGCFGVKVGSVCVEKLAWKMYDQTPCLRAWVLHSTGQTITLTECLRSKFPPLFTESFPLQVHQLSQPQTWFRIAVLFQKLRKPCCAIPPILCTVWSILCQVKSSGRLEFLGKHTLTRGRGRRARSPKQANLSKLLTNFQATFKS